MMMMEYPHLPIYNFKNTKTKKVTTEMMSISERDKYLEENPHIVQVPPDAINVADAVRIGVTKPPSDFQKHVLGRIKEKHPLGFVGKGRFQIPRG